MVHVILVQLLNKIQIVKQLNQILVNVKIVIKVLVNLEVIVLINALKDIKLIKIQVFVCS